MSHHLAVMYQRFIKAIMDRRKTVESRFSRLEHPVYEALRPGDLIWFKQVSGPVRAVATARSIRRFSDLTPHMVELIRKEWGREIDAPLPFWRSQRQARSATLIWLTDVTAVEPFMIDKLDRRAWVVLDGPPSPRVGGPAAKRGGVG
jgi:hypothetical protein